eukprot:5738777-Pyramimonas_sp.AAC.1
MAERRRARRPGSRGTWRSGTVIRGSDCGAVMVVMVVMVVLAVIVGVVVVVVVVLYYYLEW